jgi:hypothetical protein
MLLLLRLATTEPPEEAIGEEIIGRAACQASNTGGLGRPHRHQPAPHHLRGSNLIKFHRLSKTTFRNN